MSNPVTPGQPGGTPQGASGPHGEQPPPGQYDPAASREQGHGQFGAAPTGQGQFGPAPTGQGQFGPAPTGQGQFGAAPTGQGQFGPAPTGQGQFGAAPTGQGQFGAAPPGYPPPPGQGPMGAAVQAGVNAPVKKRGRARLIISLVSVVVVVIIAIVGWVASRSNPVNAQVGDCLRGSDINSTASQEVNDIKIVSCTSSDAKYKVVGKVDNKTRSQYNTDDTICQPYVNAGATREMWGQTNGENGFILCLSAVGK